MQSNHEKIYSYFLLLYPKSFRTRFGDEMVQTYHDMYADHKDTEFIFWTKLITDTLLNAMKEHIFLMKKEGTIRYMKKNWHVTNYNRIGIFLLLPILTALSIDVISRILQGDVVHYNRPVYTFLSHTPLYSFPVLFTWAILFPLLAVVINLIPLTIQLGKKRAQVFSIAYVKHNSVTLFLAGISLGLLSLIKLHDIVPCVIHGLFGHGFGQLLYVMKTCRNA